MRHRLMTVSVVAAVLLAVVGGTAFLFGGQTYHVNAYFFSAEGLTPNNDVVMGGMPIGRISDVRLGSENQAQGGAIVAMEIDQRFAPLRVGTRATIRQKGLLGNMFVDLTPGPGSNPAIASGGILPIQDTSTPVDLDQVTDIFDKNTRDKIQTMTRQGGTALQGNGTEINKLLGQLPAITANTTDVTGNLDSRYNQLDALTVEFDRVAYQMASEDQAFRADLTNGASILNVLAAHDQRLQDEITYGNLTLSELNTVLNGNQGNLNQLLKEMPGLLQQQQSWADQNSTALAILDPCVGDIISTIAEMQSAQSLRPNPNSPEAKAQRNGGDHPQNGQTDPGNGQVLRVDAQPVAAAGTEPTYGTINHPPTVACTGSHP